MRVIELEEESEDMIQTHLGKASAHIRKAMEMISDLEYEEYHEKYRRAVEESKARKRKEDQEEDE